MKKVELVTFNDLERMLLDCLRNNELPDCFLHTDTVGLKNYIIFHQHLLNPSQYQTLARRFRFFRELLPDQFKLICIGIGNGKEEYLLIKELKDKTRQLFFLDSSSLLIEMILRTASRLGIDSTGIVAFFEDLEILLMYWHSPVVYCLLGNRFCYYDGENILGKVADIVTENDFFLFNCLVLDPDKPVTFEIEMGYKSREHVQFNAAPLLSHGAGIDDFQFHLDLLLSGSAAGPVYRTRKSINFLRPTEVNCTEGSVQFKAGEKLSMGSIYKYSVRQVRTLLNAFGFTIVGESLHGSDFLVLSKRTPAPL